MPSGATTADQTSAGKGDKSPCNGGYVKSHERALLWRGVTNSVAQEDATHISYFTWEHLIERIQQQGAEDCKDKRKQWSPFGAGEKKIGLSETTLAGFVERLCEQGPALTERLCEARNRLRGGGVGGIWVLLMMVPMAETVS